MLTKHPAINAHGATSPHPPTQRAVRGVLHRNPARSFSFTPTTFIQPCSFSSNAYASMLSLHFTFLLTISSVALTSALPSALDFTPAGIHNPHLSRRALIDVNALAGVLAPSDVRFTEYLTPIELSLTTSLDSAAPDPWLEFKPDSLLETCWRSAYA